MGLWVRGLSLLAVVVVALLPCLVFAMKAVPNGHLNLLPHRAFYSFSMKPSSISEQFVDVGGGVSSTLERTCDGWISSEQVKMRVSLQSERQWNQDLVYTSWESFDGRNYRFAARSSNNGKVIKYRGHARTKEDFSGEAIYTEPKKTSMDLPPGTRFYFGLTSWLIKKARLGKRRAESIIFDGSDLEGPQKVVAFIIPLKPKTKDVDTKSNAILGSLVNKPGWNIYIAFYPLGGMAAEPDYEVQAVMLENGVIPKLELVFTSFTAVQTLEKIEKIKVPEC